MRQSMRTKVGENILPLASTDGASGHVSAAPPQARSTKLIQSRANLPRLWQQERHQLPQQPIVCRRRRRPRVAVVGGSRRAPGHESGGAESTTARAAWRERAKNTETCYLPLQLLFNVPST